MKVTLEFDGFEDKEQIERTMAVNEIISAVWDALQEMRSVVKYDEKKSEEYMEGYEAARDVIYKHLSANEVSKFF
jgi:hypothetical protein